MSSSPAAAGRSPLPSPKPAGSDHRLRGDKTDRRHSEKRGQGPEQDSMTDTNTIAEQEAPVSHRSLHRKDHFCCNLNPPALIYCPVMLGSV